MVMKPTAAQSSHVCLSFTVSTSTSTNIVRGFPEVNPMMPAAMSMLPAKSKFLNLSMKMTAKATSRPMSSSIHDASLSTRLAHVPIKPFQPDTM